MAAALLRVKKYPREIETCLQAHYHNADIGQWWRGEMSSRKLINLIDGLPGDSWFWTVVRLDHERIEEQNQLDAARDVKQRNVSELYASVPKHLWPKDRKAVRS